MRVRKPMGIPPVVGALLLVCGCPQVDSGGDPPPPEPYTLDGINFSPFTQDGEDPTQGSVISPQDLWDRLAMIADDATWIRTYGVDAGLDLVGDYAHQMGKFAAIGCWLDDDLSTNDLQVQGVIDLAAKGHADMVIVGSEVVLRDELTPAELIGYIETVKSTAPSNTLVATADQFQTFLLYPEIVPTVDVLLVNYYPYWSGVEVGQAVSELNCWHKAMEAFAFPTPVVVSETGWPSEGDVIADAVPSPENAALYFKEFVSLARQDGIPYFYFEALDEPWKAQYEGPQGAHWGIRDQDGVLKPGMQDVLLGYTTEGPWDVELLPGGPGTPELMFTYVPPYLSTDDLEGQILHVSPVIHAVAVYIKVNGGWWTKPYFTKPLTFANCDGFFTTDITTGGIDEQASHVAAFLVPYSFDPPLLSGSSSLPSSLYDSSLANVIVQKE